MSRAIPVTADDARKRLRLLRMVVDALETQAAVCKLIGVDSSTMSRWLSGKHGAPEWFVVHAAIRRTLTRRPDLTPFFGRALLHEEIGAHVRCVLDEGDDPCELSESDDGTLELADPSETQEEVALRLIDETNEEARRG